MPSHVWLCSAVPVEVGRNELMNHVDLGVLLEEFLGRSDGALEFESLLVVIITRTAPACDTCLRACHAVLRRVLVLITKVLRSGVNHLVRLHDRHVVLAGLHCH